MSPRRPVAMKYPRTKLWPAARTALRARETAMQFVLGLPFTRVELYGRSRVLLCTLRPPQAAWDDLCATTRCTTEELGELYAEWSALLSLCPPHTYLGIPYRDGKIRYATGYGNTGRWKEGVALFINGHCTAHGPSNLLHVAVTPRCLPAKLRRELPSIPTPLRAYDWHRRRDLAHVAGEDEWAHLDEPPLRGPR